MSESREIFYYSRSRLSYVAVSFMLTPCLLYIFKVWTLPPTLLHGLAFLAATIAGICFVVYQWSRPKLILEDDHIRCGETYPFKDIAAIRPHVGVIKLIMTTDKGHDVKTLNMQWAGRSQFKNILETISSRMYDFHE